MLIEISEFCSRVDSQLDELVEELQDLTGREGDNEKYAWTSSLPVLANSLRAPQLSKLHIYFQRKGQLEVEYRLPASGSWCDAVLLGQGVKGPASVILELKHWVTSSDRPGPNESLINHNGDLVSHPSVQVGSYVEYCQRFHSAIHKNSANVFGGVLFTRSTNLSAYLQPPHDQLIRRFPVFGCNDSDLLDRLPNWIAQNISEPNERFAQEFSEGVYQQDRRFVRHVSSLLQDPTSSPFVLLDEQRKAYDLILHEIEGYAANATQDSRLVVIVEGPPGSGKSVLAAQLWAKMAVHPIIEGNTVLCTTSGCQRSNWEHLFSNVASSSAGAGLVVPANAFNPGLLPVWIKQKRTEGKTMAVSDWKENLKIFAQSGKRSRSPDMHFATTIVDEGHALIDPSAPNAEGVSPSGWCMHAGPQVWHIIRSSKVTIILMDGEQSYRDNETTTPQQVTKLANTFSNTKVVNISLRDAQFRCGGSKEYIEWVEEILETSVIPEPPSLEWRRSSANPSGAFEFDVLATPYEVEKALRSRQVQGASVRLLASYARPWSTKGIPDPHNIPESLKDFNIKYSSNGSEHIWTKIWNYAPEQDYTYFIQARKGTQIANDPLCEVGCPYVVRGFDFDFIGLVWLSDLVRRNNRWEYQLKHIHESAWKKTIAAVKRNANNVNEDALISRLKRGYRILLTRAIKGVFVWCEDEETRDYLKTKLT